MLAYRHRIAVTTTTLAQRVTAVIKYVVPIGSRGENNSQGHLVPTRTTTEMLTN